MAESQHTEWKESWRDEYLKWICAFANTSGGILEIGKDDSGVVKPLVDYQALLESIPQKIKNGLGIICAVNLEGAVNNHFIRIQVNVYSNPISYKGKYYIRSGSTTNELNGVELNDFLLAKSGRTWDDLISNDASLEDIDPESIKKVIADSTGKGRLPDTSGLTTLEILTKLRLAQSDKLKNGAIVLFGKDPNVYFPNCKVMIGRFGTDSEDLKFQEFLEGNIVELLHQVQDQLNYKFLTRPIDFKGMMRIEGDEYPVAALREMLLNALVHKKYMGSAIQIRVFDDKISIWNEGLLPKGLTELDLKKEHNSRPSNPVIADVCFKAGYIDTWGRGTIKIYKACKDAGMPEPSIVQKNGGIEVTLYKSSSVLKESKSSHKDIGMSMERVRDEFGMSSEEIRKAFVKRSQSVRKQFGTSVEITFKLMFENPEYTAEQLAEKLNIVHRTVQKHQAKLKEAGYIQRVGGNNAGHWEILLE